MTPASQNGRPSQAERGTDACLVVGADGLIGRALVSRLHEAFPKVIETTRRTAGPSASRHILDLSSDLTRWPVPRVAVAYLCAATTEIAACEENPRETRRINVDATFQIARALADSGAFVIFPSSNFVFGDPARSYGEDDRPSPTTEYGRQKSDLEALLSTLRPAPAIVRLAKVIHAETPLVKEWLASLTADKIIEPFRNRSFVPVPLSFVTGALLQIGVQRCGGTFHLSCDQSLTYEEFAIRLASRLGKSSRWVRATDAPEGMGGTPWPSPPVLRSTRLSTLTGLMPPTLEECIDGIASTESRSTHTGLTERPT